LSICQGSETQIKLSPRTRGPKNYSGFRVLTSYFYFYIRFRTATVIVDGGDIFGIWKVGEEIWMSFFWVKGLRFLFFSWRGWGWGSRGLNRWKWTGVRNAKDQVGGSTWCIMHQIHTSFESCDQTTEYQNIHTCTWLQPQVNLLENVSTVCENGTYNFNPRPEWQKISNLRWYFKKSFQP